MIQNTPILTQAEELRAPWNTKLLPVDISISMSIHTEIEVPKDFDESDIDRIKEITIDQIEIPIDIIGKSEWIIDDYSVIV